MIPSAAQATIIDGEDFGVGVGEVVGTVVGFRVVGCGVYNGGLVVDEEIAIVGVSVTGAGAYSRTLSISPIAYLNIWP